ncbi:MAG TPA: response regulator, partial [Gammaproteobacteria bacterium]|nr:response regulator [Gammaproteobacteria bacterium]
EQDEPVRFSWKRPEELRVLARNLTRLAERHAADASALRSHARELEESNRYKSEFLANVSHELRTPLNSILLLSKMLAGASDRLSPEQLQQADVIHEAGKDLRTLIDSILDLSRIEAGKASLKIGTVDLKALLGEIFQLMHPQFDEKGLRLELDIESEAPSTIETDHEKLRQILINFLSNALKFTERGDVVLRLSRNEGEDAAPRPLAISVSDSGIGIPADKQELVFEAFKQADGSTSRRYGGTGLGLTISRELARLIGGRIQVHSEEGKGSTFTLFLPLAIDRDSAEQAPGQSDGEVHEERKDSELPDADYSGNRILVVDDDLRNLLALTPLLEHWGLEVVAAGDGPEALETLGEDNGFDLILMDLMMPGMDGFDTMSRIRTLDALKTIPIVALTARVGEEDRARAIASGADAVLAKPLDALELKSMLDRYLAGSTTTAAAEDRAEVSP